LLNNAIGHYTHTCWLITF